MPETAAAPGAEETLLMHPIVKALIAQVRAQDSYGVWEGKSDGELLEPFIVDREKARAMPIIDDPDPDTLDRLSQFYSTIGLEIERRCGVMASPMMQISPEGFGRVVLTCGRLVVINRHLRDVHRFGFASLDALAERGEALVAEALEWISAHRDVAEL